MALTSTLLVDLGIKGSQLTTPDTLPAKYSNKQARKTVEFQLLSGRAAIQKT